MNPAIYKRQNDATKYAADLESVWPKSLCMTFAAVIASEGYKVVATDRNGRRYYVTPRSDRLASVNFIPVEPI